MKAPSFTGTATFDVNKWLRSVRTPPLETNTTSNITYFGSLLAFELLYLEPFQNTIRGTLAFSR